jgi:hypothetical protein
MKATILTTEQIRACEGKNYNPQIWDNNINRMLKYSDVVFYHVSKGDGYDYDRYFVEYTLPEGLRLFASFGYSSSLTSGDFYRLDKTAITEDGRTYASLVDLVNSGKNDEAKQLGQQLMTATKFDISYGKFSMETEDGKVDMVTIGTSEKARAWMIERSTKYGLTFTKG